ncbi:MAG: aminoglycoside/choline kinase family phosphotransferase [Gammaproteobacteria bacterium]|jgi:aminoglycoside/choline kinase family phosphotransferase
MREQLMISWLQTVLGPGWRWEPLAGDASFRRYMRVYQGVRTWVLMDAPPEQESTVAFERVAQMLSASAMRVPRIEAADREQGFLLLSDLGDELFLGVLDERTADVLYGRAMQALVSVQRDVPCDNLPVYDGARLRDELTLFPQWFLNVHLRYEPTLTQTRELEEVFEVLEQAALAQPAYFVHRDYHSRNLLVCGDALGVVDFQDAVCGPVTYDLVSLLRDVYIAWPDEAVARWAEQYRVAACKAGLLDADSAQFRRWFDLMGVQRHLKVAGIFARLFHRDAKPAYLPDLPLTLRYLRAVAVRYPELRPLEELFFSLGDAMADDRLVARVSHRRGTRE